MIRSIEEIQKGWERCGLTFHAKKLKNGSYRARSESYSGKLTAKGNTLDELVKNIRDVVATSGIETREVDLHVKVI